MEIRIFNMNTKIKFPLVRQGGTAAILCIVCTVFMAMLLAGGCNEKEELSKNDQEETILKNPESAPNGNMSKEALPEWFIPKIESLETGGELGIPTPFKLFRGIWNGQICYYLQIYVDNCGTCATWYENGEKIVWKEDGDFVSLTKGWEIVYELTIEDVLSSRK